MLYRDVSGVVAVEFATLSTVFFGMVFGIFLIVYVNLAQAQLDQASEAAARAVMTLQSADTASLQQTIQSSIAAMIDPTQVQISLTPYSSIPTTSVTNNPTLTYKKGKLKTQFQQNFGSSGQIMVLQLVYQLPVFTTPYLSIVSLYQNTNTKTKKVSTYNNNTHELVSTQVFVEEFSAPSS